jgi:hypothetical protein
LALAACGLSLILALGGAREIGFADNFVPEKTPKLHIQRLTNSFPARHLASVKEGTAKCGVSFWICIPGDGVRGYHYPVNWMRVMGPSRWQGLDNDPEPVARFCHQVVESRNSVRRPSRSVFCVFTLRHSHY